ncbi:MAG: hypothetical protein GXY20_01910 [Clostridiales bacterium]|nr:hypothetical protein [Clostridiales bacterium]
MTVTIRSAFSSDGYIIDQSLTKEFRYGSFSSPYNGCGWIACYNLLLASGIKTSCGEVIAALTPTLQLGGLIGTRMRHVQAYLRSKGLNVQLTKKSAGIISVCEKADHGILWYWDGLEPHFIAFTRVGDGTFRFFNAVEGEENHISDIRSFLKKHTFVPCVRVLTVIK